MSATGVAVVGCGFQGRLHLRYLREIAEVELIAVCDRDRDRAAAAAGEFGVPAIYSDHRELLDRDAPELVSVCTMPNSHREIAVAAMAAGADVICEKPMAHDLADAEAMAAAAQRYGRILSIGFNMRHTEAARAIRAFVEAGDLGSPVCARGAMLERAIPWWGPHQVKAISGGGAIAATAVHMIDLLMWLAGSPRPSTVSASMTRLFPRKRGSDVPEAVRHLPYDVEDLAFGHVRFDNGFWLTIEGGWNWEAPGCDWLFDLVGERGQASLEPLRLWREIDGSPTDVTGSARGGVDFEGSVAVELRDMVEAVRERREPVTTAQQALEVQAVVDAFYRSAEAGHEVEVANLREGVSA